MHKTSDNASPGGRREEDVLRHVAMYRVTLMHVVWKQFWPDAQQNAVVKAMGRLVTSGLLQRLPLIHPQVYFIMSATTAKRFGKGVRWSHPPGPQALPADIATLLYCTGGERLHERMNDAQIRKRFSWFPHGGSHFVFCRDGDRDSSVLEWVRTDIGGPGHHIVRKTHRQLEAWMDSAAFSERLHCGVFRIVFLSPTDGKLDSIHQSINGLDWPTGINLHLAVIPQLLSLSTRYHHGT